MVGKGPDTLNDASHLIYGDILLSLGRRYSVPALRTSCAQVFYNLYYNSFEQIQVIYDMVWYRCHSHILFDLGDDCDTFLLLVSLMYVIVMYFFWLYLTLTTRRKWNFWKN